MCSLRIVAVRIPDVALLKLKLEVGEAAVYLIEKLVGNTRCVVLLKTPKIAVEYATTAKPWFRRWFPRRSLIKAGTYPEVGQDL